VTVSGAFSGAIREAKKKGRTPVIIDIKPVSPRDGDLLKQREPEELARMAEQAGACALSVVTEPDHFGGSIDMLRDVARSCSLPVLQKDFFSSPAQVEESFEAGASAFLIILATTSNESARKLYQKGIGLGMEAVVEIHTAGELRRAISIEPVIIGINNRDISKLEMDAGDVRVTETLAPGVPEHILTLSESSLQSKNDVMRAIHAGADAVLVGTAALKSDNFHACLKDWVGISRSNHDAR
jgi:indole-3-glycerol phosphate synthase